jgi:glyoxylase-like metal-dependent hydrolase (beta-lactamase superfamily II)
MILARREGDYSFPVVNPLLLLAHNPSPMTGAGNNTYLISGNGSAALIDAGVGGRRHLDELAGALRAAQVPLTSVLVTHAHVDHASGAPALAASYPSAAFHKLPWPEEDARYPVPWRRLNDGALLPAGGETLTALHTPGHSPDHVAFWHERSRTVFSGDLVALDSSVMIHWSRGGDLGQYLGSLRRLLALEPVRLLPAHGRAIEDPRAVLQGYLAHRQQREEQVIAALQAGHTTVETIGDSIYHGLAPALQPAARENVRAHLEKLRTEGRALLAEDQWTSC